MAIEVEELLVSVAEFQRTRHFGKYRGLVSDVSDPEGMGRIRATVPAAYHDQDSPWAMPSVPFAGPSHGFVVLPEVGDGVWIEFEGGDLARPIWSGCWWASGQLPSPGAERVRLLATSAGHQVVLDEQADEIKLIHPGGAEVTIAAGAITLELGACTLEISPTEIDLNNGMVKVTVAGVSLVNDSMKFGA